MLAFSAYQYRHFAETYDFAIYNQAWTSIAHGRLDPWSSLLGAPFWRNNAELVLWPLAGLYWISPHPFDLLVVQDAAVVATELLTLDWVFSVIGRSRMGPHAAAALGSGAAVVLALDPWAWNTIAFDFHSHVLAAFFAVAAGRDLWNGRTSRCWVWAVAALLSDAPGALYLVGVGLAAACTSRQARRSALAVTVVAASWFVVITTVGGDGVGGAGLGSWYGYLAGGGHHVGLGSVALGALRHPARLATMASPRWMTVFRFVGVAGLIGVCSPWGFFPAAAVFLPSVFNADPSFLRVEQSFQSWPAIPFVLVGTVMILVRWSALGGPLRRLVVPAAGSWAALFAVLAWSALPAVPRYWLAVGTPAAGTLARAQSAIPKGAEIAASNGVIGRFASRRWVYELGRGPGGTSIIPVKAPIVVFVIAASQGVADPGEAARADVSALQALGATTLVSGGGIDCLELRVPAGQEHVSLP